jgi:hypothetical protein
MAPHMAHYGCEWPVLCAAHIIPTAYLTESYMATTASLDAVEKREIFCPHWESNASFSVIHSTHSLVTT